MFESFSDSLHTCPMVKLGRYAAQKEISAELLAYLDYGGLTGTCTDSLCDGMLAICRERGELEAGGAVIEACGGTFAVSLASACARQGHPLYVVLPAETSLKKQEEIRALGAKIALFSGGLSVLAQRAAQSAAELSAYYLNYMNNDANSEYHRRLTGPSIMRQCPLPEAVIVGVGSGGAISGIGESVKAWHPDCKIIAVEPYESRAISGGIIGSHGITGIGFGFVTELYNRFIVDKVIAVSTQSALQEAKDAQIYEGVPASASCGAVLSAAKTLNTLMPHLKNIICVFPSRIFD